MKDWAYLTTVEEMEEATNSLLENGKKVGADSWQQRVKNQTPHCGFGESGTCCRIIWYNENKIVFLHAFALMSAYDR